MMLKTLFALFPFILAVVGGYQAPISGHSSNSNIAKRQHVSLEQILTLEEVIEFMKKDPAYTQFSTPDAISQILDQYTLGIEKVSAFNRSDGPSALKIPGAKHLALWYKGVTFPKQTVSTTINSRRRKEAEFVISGSKYSQR
jgi:hypothetical protein